MRAAICFALFLAFLLPPAFAQAQGFQDALLDRFVGNWVMRGTIAGNEVTHDVVAEWVLAHQYLRFQEVARETDSTGAPAYEAIVIIGWDEPTGRYACLWLDVTGGGGLSNDATGYAEPAEDEIAFVFPTGETSAIHNTFTYDRDADTWHWHIVIVRNGKRSTFADVSLTRR